MNKSSLSLGRPDIGEAERRLARGDHRGAYVVARALLDGRVEQGRAAHVLGLIAAEHGNLTGAEALFREALAAEPAAARHHAQLARSLVGLQRPDEARASAVAALALGPTDAHALDTLGVVFSRLGDHRAALPLLRAAVARDGRNAGLRFNLAAAEQFTGDLEAAAAAYREAVRIDPGHYTALSALAQLKRHTTSDNLLEELDACLAVAPADPDRALHMGHALAKAYEDLGDPERAMAALARGKAVKRATLNYDVEAEASVFRAAGESWDHVRGSGCPDGRPIFVVGLPRTGTTLVDRILSSHPDVTAAGELTHFAVLAKRMAGTPGPRVLEAAVFDRAGEVDMAELGRRYLAAAAPNAGWTARFTDKMPLNVVYAGLIARAFPEGRIVCLRRHPLDTVLSMYRQLFATGFSYYGFSYDLADTAKFYVHFDRLVGVWRERLPKDRFLEVSYEGVVADLEGEARRLLAFCGLDWDDRCLAFHENTAPVATASSAQVRRPLYASSVGRWRRYAPYMQPAVDVLRRAGLLDAT